MKYELTLKAVANHPWKPEQRLKRLLKIAGRVLGLRCVALREAKPPTEGGESADAS